jgi:phosphatidate cytidylyltransferase
MNSFTKRLLSALIMGPIMLYALYQGDMIFKSLVGIMMLVAIYEFYSIAKNEVKKRWRLSVLLFGLIYSVLTYFAMTELRVDYGFVFVGLIIVGIWASDIGAYIFGKLIGGRKLCPSISPNKTWAGLIGACLFPSFILDGYLAFFATDLSPRETILWSFGASLVIGLLGQMGDLLISLLKRRVGLKDTGRLIPGHGGVLDRIDALMLVSIVIWTLMTLKVVLYNENLISL